MAPASSRRGNLVILLGITTLVLLLIFSTLNAFRLNFLNPVSPIQTLVFIALSVLAFLLFVGVLVLLVRNVLKLYADQRSRVLGTRLRTRMLWGAALVSLVPLAFMFAFSYMLMNRAVDRWFSQPVTEMRDDADRMATELFRYAATNSRAEAGTITAQLADLPLFAPNNPTAGISAQAQRVLQEHELSLQGGFVLLYRNGAAIASLNVPQDSPNGEIKSLQPPSEADERTPDEEATGPASPSRVLHGAVSLRGPVQHAILQAAQRGGDDPFYTIAGNDYTLATAGLQQGGIVVVGLPIPAGITDTSLRLRKSADAYWLLYRERRKIRNLYMVILLLVTGLAVFAICWLALNLSKQVTRPIESLADAMEAIAMGDYAYRVGEFATEELGELVDRFNAMANDLESAHETAARSTLKLSELNYTLEQRTSELETIIETIPNGVVTLSATREIVLSNRAFSEMLDPGGQKIFIGLPISSVLPVELTDALDLLLRRAHRMGSASGEIEMPSPSGTLHISATAALLELGSSGDRAHVGYVIVIEDATELLHAQKQSAWKEVARRVAHEIKNPLTPIGLNAELIARHIPRLNTLLADNLLQSPSIATMQRSVEVISASVETMRALVDQFSSLAEFPTSRPRPADLNTIVDSALALFAGRLRNINLKQSLAPNLPLILADPEALKRALTNLIDNAAEAMQNSLLRELHITTRSLSSTTVELTVADTGPGLTDEMRERLFLPYFSTKQRGTGLGLSIAAKIVQEHQGTIRAEKNLPAGAVFILELRTASTTESETSDTLPINERISA
ncbi:sensor histidine kinase [Granulicella paludicola]|uniref:sensor histidine kinase n=1 Tax=Granulicella paludicola TaxID=474951 RepID=UPI0021E085FF|nr:ATP-binding protein [Granulicella paludicola]